MDIIVVGGGISGLSTALKLSRAGHQITVLERDNTPMPENADEAFAWDRRGAPQVRHSHAFLARLVSLLRQNEPDVLEKLFEAGATEIKFGEDLPSTMVGFVPEAEDAELSMLTCRRTTFEWVLRRVVLDEGRVIFKTGVGVNGFTHTVDDASGRKQITGVTLENGTTLAGDLVVVAGGQRRGGGQERGEARRRGQPRHVDGPHVGPHRPRGHVRRDAELRPRVRAGAG